MKNSKKTAQLQSEKCSKTLTTV